MAGSNRLGDIPGARFHAPELSNSAIASNGANARLGQMGPFPYDIIPRTAYFTPTSGAQSATQSATYRQLTLQNGGTVGTGTSANLASHNFTATVAQYLPLAIAVDSTQKVSAGQLIVVSQATVGGTDANGTVLAGGILTLDYEIV